MNTRKTLALFFALTLIFFNVDFSFAKGGRGFSGGGSRSFSGGGSRGGGGSRSFGGGSRSGGGWNKPSYSGPSPSRPSAPSFRPSTPSRPSPSVRPPSAPISPGRSFSSGPSAPAVKQPIAPSKPSTTYDAAKQRAAEQERSRQSFESSKTRERAVQQPAVSSRTSEPDRQRVRDLRRELNYKKMENRELRQREFYGSYYSRPIPTYYRSYNDGYNIFFWMWLMDRPRHDRDTWIYNHRDSVDPQRYAELRRNDSDLDRRLQALETQGMKKNPSYVPEGMDRDLMYSDEKVKQVYTEANSSSFPWGWIFLIIILGVCVLAFFKLPLFRKRG